MPELPEVETVKRGLKELIVGQKVLQISHDWPKSFPNAEADVKRFVIGADIVDVTRRAKILFISLNSKYSLLIHLKMTGQLVYKSHDERLKFGAGHPSDSLINELPDRSTRVIMKLSKGTLFFNDQRKFGWVKLIPDVEIPNIDFMKKLGPEPLAADFTAQDFQKRLHRRPNTTIKAALLDQTVIAGVGNIYADESLFAAKIHPSSRVKDISPTKLKELFKALQNILNLSIKKGGSTDRNYVDARGKKGSYLSFAHVFRKNGQPCPRCGTIIEKHKVAGRGTHICPRCQKLPKKRS